MILQKKSCLTRLKTHLRCIELYILTQTDLQPCQNKHGTSNIFLTVPTFCKTLKAWFPKNSESNQWSGPEAVLEAVVGRVCRPAKLSSPRDKKLNSTVLSLLWSWWGGRNVLELSAVDMYCCCAEHFFS